MGDGAPIRVVVNRHEEAEAERVASEMLTRRIKENAEWRDFAVLYRGNFQARLLELKLQHYQIPYKLSGGTSFFSRNEIKDAMAYLRLLINPADDNAFLRIVNVPRREIGPGTLEKLANYATERSISLFAACHELGLEQTLPTRAVERLSRFTHFIDGVRKRMDQGDAIAAIRDMLRDMDYEAWLYQKRQRAHHRRASHGQRVDIDRPTGKIAGPRPGRRHSFHRDRNRRRGSGYLPPGAARHSRTAGRRG